MKMYPPTLYPTSSLAERTVFEQLRQSFVDKPYVAMHSLLLCRHAHKRFAEIDFLLCSDFGLFVLEVKGGQVSCTSGLWHYQDKYGNHNTGGSPFYQANSGLQGLRQSLTEHFGKAVVDRICFGYGVIFTDSRLPKQVLCSPEYDRAMICHAGEHRYLQGWLSELFVYWYRRNKAIVPQIAPVSTELLAKLVAFIRPDFVSGD